MAVLKLFSNRLTLLSFLGLVAYLLCIPCVGAATRPKPPTVKGFTIETGDGRSFKNQTSAMDIDAAVAVQGVKVTANIRKVNQPILHVVLTTVEGTRTVKRGPFSFYPSTAATSSFRPLGVGSWVFKAQAFSRNPVNKKKKLKGKVVTFTVNVRAPVVTPTPTPARARAIELPNYVAPGSEPAIPGYAAFAERMTSFAATHCDPVVIADTGTFEGGIWNFDGLRVYQNIAAVTADPRWLDCAALVKNVYRSYVLSVNGQLPGWRVWTAGLLLDWRRTGDPLSSQAISLLARNAAFANQGGGAELSLSLETANFINAYIASSEIGDPQTERLAIAVNYAITHLRAWQTTPQERFQPYLVAHTSDALINWYIQSGDPRIIPEVDAALNWLWNTHYDPTTKSFPTLVCAAGVVDPECSSPRGIDLNLYIASTYAWVWRTTGNPVARGRAEELFAAGVVDGYLGRGKQFSQNYGISFNIFKFLF